MVIGCYNTLQVGSNGFFVPASINGNNGNNGKKTRHSKTCKELWDVFFICCEGGTKIGERMLYTYAEIQKAQETKLPAVLYAIETYKTALTDNDIKAVENALRRQQRKAPFISWFVAVSNTESDTAVKTVEKTGKRGRPHTIVTGRKVKNHVHIGVVGDKENSAYTAAKNVGLSINKRFRKKVTKVVTMQGTGFVAYSYQQANKFHTGGDFGLNQYKEPALWE